MEACRFLALLADPSGVLYEVSPHREPLDKTRSAPVGNRYGSPCATIHTSVYPLSVGVRARGRHDGPQPHMTLPLPSLSSSIAAQRITLGYCRRQHGCVMLNYC